MKDIVIVDIDGTISKIGDRLKYLQQSPKNWDAFYADSFKDEPIIEMVNLVKSLNVNYRIVFCTGRRESTRQITKEWIFKYMKNIWFPQILMRPNNDLRPDEVVKIEQVKLAGINFDEIAFVLEDRSRMVSKWRSLGVRCLQVDVGDF